MFPGSDLYCTDPAKYTITTCIVIDHLDNLARDLFDVRHIFAGKEGSFRVQLASSCLRAGYVACLGRAFLLLHRPLHKSFASLSYYKK